MSGLAVTPENAERVGVAAVGSGIGGLATLEEQHKILLERGPGRMSPFFIPGMIINMASGRSDTAPGSQHSHGHGMLHGIPRHRGSGTLYPAWRRGRHDLRRRRSGGGVLWPWAGSRP